MYNILEELENKGYKLNDPWDAVTIFENKLAEYGGSKYAVCVDSCSNAIFLCLKYFQINGKLIELPRRTYASVPMQCIHANNRIKFTDINWEGEYTIGDTNIIDSATRFKRGMHVKGTHRCLSFHHRKTLKIGRGGAILTDDEDFVKWLRPAIYDGRHKDVQYVDDSLAVVGWHMYMTPEEAAMGILKFDELGDDNPDTGSYESYPDLSLQEIFKQWIPKFVVPELDNALYTLVASNWDNIRVKEVADRFMSDSLQKTIVPPFKYDNCFYMDGYEVYQLAELVDMLSEIEDLVIPESINTTGTTIFLFYGEGYADDLIFSTVHRIIDLCKLKGDCHYRNMTLNLHKMYDDFCARTNEPKKIHRCIKLPNGFGTQTLRFPPYANTYRHYDVQIDLSNEEDKKLFCCFNVRPTLHRAALISLLHYNDLIPEGVVSTPNYFQKEKEKYVKEDDWNNLLSMTKKQLGSYDELSDVITKLESLNPIYPLRLDDRSIFNDVNHLASAAPLLYKSRIESLFEIVSETLAEGEQFYTEKTFFPIFLGKPFIMVNSKDALKGLRSLGYKTFSPLIDESYDEEPDTGLRLIKITKELARLNKLRHDSPDEFYKMYKELLEIAEYNKECFSKTK